jgi:hypothetical protein
MRTDKPNIKPRSRNYGFGNMDAPMTDVPAASTGPGSGMPAANYAEQHKVPKGEGKSSSPYPGKPV